MYFRTIPPVGYRISIKNALRAIVQRNKTNQKQLDDGVEMAFDSGSAALLFLLENLKEQNPTKSQVIVPVYTCYSIAAVIEHAGLEIVLCDLNPDTLDFNYAELEECINKNTLAIISTHFFGRKLDYNQLEQIKNTTGAIIIEDAAQGGHSIASLGRSSDFIVTSTGRGKPVSTLGGGYLIAQNNTSIIQILLEKYNILADRTLVEEVLVLAKIFIVNILLNPYLYTIPFSMPYFRIGETIYPETIPVKKLTNFQQKLFMHENSDRLNSIRNKHVKYYYHNLKQQGSGLQPSLSCSEIDSYAPMRYPVYLSQNINTEHENTLDKMCKYGIVKMYPKLLSDLDQIKSFCFNFNKLFPGGNFIVKNLVTLPTHALLNKHDLEIIVNATKRVVN